MSVYGNLSKPQRRLLDQLLQEGAVSPDKARCTRSRAVDRLLRLGFVQASRGYYYGEAYAHLTPAGLDLLRGLNFSHLGGSRQRARA